MSQRSGRRGGTDLFRGYVPNWGTDWCGSVSGKSLNLPLKVCNPFISPLAKGGQRDILQVGSIDLVLKVTDMLPQHVDLVLKLAVVLFQVDDCKRAHIRVLVHVGRSGQTH